MSAESRGTTRLFVFIQQMERERMKQVTRGGCSSRKKYYRRRNGALEGEHRNWGVAAEKERGVSRRGGETRWPASSCLGNVLERPKKSR